MSCRQLDHGLVRQGAAAMVIVARTDRDVFVSGRLYHNGEALTDRRPAGN